MSEQQNDNRLREGYERLLERMQGGANELTWDNLQKDLDDAVEFEAELEEYTKDELALLRAWVERDLKDAYPGGWCTPPAVRRHCRQRC